MPEMLELPIPRYMKENEGHLVERDDLIDKYLRQEDRHLPEEEEIVIRNPVELDPAAEFHMILVNERGRQGIIRGQQKRAEYIANLRKKKKLDQDKNKEAEAIQVI